MIRAYSTYRYDISRCNIFLLLLSLLLSSSVIYIYEKKIASNNIDVIKKSYELIVNTEDNISKVTVMSKF